MRSAITPQARLSHVGDLDETLRARYRDSPELAWATHLAWTDASGAALADPYRGVTRTGLVGRELPYALDDAVGGPKDEPTPGEILCAALAASLDATLRLVAIRRGITVASLAVIVTGDVDARGALGDPDVPVGFQSLRVEVQLRLADGTPPGTADHLLGFAERQRELMATLRTGVPVELVTEEIA